MRKFKRIISTILTLGLTLSYMPAVTLQVNAYDSAEIESDKMAVLIDQTFPNVVQYVWKQTNEIFYGQDTAINSIKINNVSYVPTVSFSLISSNDAKYIMTFDSINVSMEAHIKVEDNILSFDITDINENGTVKVMSIEIPNHNLISVKNTQAGAAFAGTKMTLFGDAQKDFHISLTDIPAVDLAPVGYMYAFINSDKFAAGIWSNAVQENPGDRNVITDNQRIQKQTVQIGTEYITSLWSGKWTYRATRMPDNLTEPLPSTKVVITPDINNDGNADWQDGAIEYRKIMNVPFGSENVPDMVVHRVPCNFAGTAGNPFLKSLDETKRVYLATDGLGQNVQLRGYQSEGHDSAHPDFDAVSLAQGGIEDLNTLANASQQYNTWVGLHINDTESYPEAKSFNEELVNKNSPAWAWLDQSYHIDVRYEAASRNRYNRLLSLKTMVPGLKFMYVDAWFGDGVDSRQFAREINDMGWWVETEFGTPMEYDSLLSREAYELDSQDSNIMRFISNHQKDTWTPGNLLLGKLDQSDYETWQGRLDFNKCITATFNNLLPTKYLQHFEITNWNTNSIQNGDGTIKLTNNVVVTNDNANKTRIITKDNKKILEGDKYLLPWDPKTEDKLYHWNPAGGTTTWELPSSWSGLSTVKVYKLNDTDGKVLVDTLAVTSGNITITANANVPYVVYKGEATPQADLNWGEGSFIKDPGFNSGNLNTWSVTGDGASVQRNTNGQYELKIGTSAVTTSASQTITGLTEGKYLATVFVGVNGTRRAEISASIAGGNSFTNYTNKSNTINNNVDDRKGTNMQKMYLWFDVPANSSSAIISLGASAGTDIVIFDDLRVVRTDNAVVPQGAYFFEDFENGYRNVFPFVYGPQIRSQIHRSELHAPYTQKGWNGKAIDDVISGEWSLKIYKESVGLKVQTLPQNLRFEPGKKYKVSFKYESDIQDAYSFVIGDQAQITSSRTISFADTPQTFEMELTASQSGETFIGINCIIDGVGTFVLDDLLVEEISETSLLSKAGMTATASTAWPGVGQATNAIDNNLDTMWHSLYGNPQDITISLGGNFNIHQVGVLPRRDNGGGGIIYEYELQLSNDNGVTFNKVAEGVMIYPGSDKSEKMITFPHQNATHIKLIAKFGSEGYSGAAEINVYKYTDLVPKAGMTATASTAWPAVGQATNAIDNNPDTIWHSLYGNPQNITISLGGSFDIDQVGVLPRLDNGGGGIINAYELWLSNDNEVTYNKVAEGVMTYPNKYEKSINFPHQNATHIKIIVTSGSEGYSGAAEINVYKYKDVGLELVIDNTLVKDLMLTDVSKYSDISNSTGGNITKTSDNDARAMWHVTQLGITLNKIYEPLVGFKMAVDNVDLSDPTTAIEVDVGELSGGYLMMRLGNRNDLRDVARITKTGKTIINVQDINALAGNIANINQSFDIAVVGSFTGMGYNIRSIKVVKSSSNRIIENLNGTDDFTFKDESGNPVYLDGRIAPIDATKLEDGQYLKTNATKYYKTEGFFISNGPGWKMKTDTLPGRYNHLQRISDSNASVVYKFNGGYSFEAEILGITGYGDMTSAVELLTSEDDITYSPISFDLEKTNVTSINGWYTLYKAKVNILPAQDGFIKIILKSGNSNLPTYVPLIKAVTSVERIVNRLNGTDDFTGRDSSGNVLYSDGTIAPTDVTQLDDGKFIKIDTSKLYKTENFSVHSGPGWKMKGNTIPGRYNHLQRNNSSDASVVYKFNGGYSLEVEILGITGNENMTSSVEILASTDDITYSPISFDLEKTSVTSFDGYYTLYKAKVSQLPDQNGFVKIVLRNGDGNLPFWAPQIKAVTSVERIVNRLDGTDDFTGRDINGNVLYSDGTIAPTDVTQLDDGKTMKIDTSKLYKTENLFINSGPGWKMKADSIPGRYNHLQRNNSSDANVIYKFNGGYSLEVEILGISGNDNMSSSVEILTSIDEITYSPISFDLEKTSVTSFNGYYTLYKAKVSKLPDLNGFVKIVLKNGDGNLPFWAPQIKAVTSVYVEPFITSNVSEIQIDNTAKMVLGISPETSLAVLMSKLNPNGGTIKFFDKNTGIEITSGNIGTGAKIRLFNASNQQTNEFTAVVRGDVDGDSDVTIFDLATLKNHLLKTEYLTGENEMAGDIFSKGKITISDLLAVKKHLMGLQSFS